MLLGAIVNAAAIAAGGLLGLLLKKGMPEKLSTAITQGLSLITIYVGVSGALEGEKILVATLSMVAGAVIGTLLDLDGRLNGFSHRLETWIVKDPGGESTFGQGFANATLLFCTGAMAVVGSLNSGLTCNHEVLFAKSMIDCVMSVVFASALGAGVLLSAVPVLLYEGLITLLAHGIAPVLTDAVVAEMTCVGSLLIVAIGTNLLGVTKVKVMNLVPAIFLPILLCLFL